MSEQYNKTTKLGTKKSKHHLFLNPYQDAAFTRCPKCDNKTKLKKFPLVIHVDPKHFISLGKTCKYCPYCDLIIVKQTELESLLAGIFEKQNPDVIGNKYLVVGTVEYKVWRQSLKKQIHSSSSELIDLIYPFKNIWQFKLHDGWYLKEK